MTRNHKNNPISGPALLIVCTALLGACKQAPVPTTQAYAKAIANAPAWYARQAFDAPGYWLGYGDALTLEQAKAVARADLAATFKTEIRASLRLDQNLDGDELSRRAETRIDQFTSAEFEDLDILRSEQQQGRYYLALGYDHRPLGQRLIARLDGNPVDGDGLQQLPTSSRLYQQLEQAMGRVPSVRLHHERGRYLLSSSGNTMAVRDDEIDALYPQVGSSELQFTLTPAQNVYAPETLFKASITTQQSGHLSYLQVFGNGAMVLMLANQPFSEGQHIDYPDPALYDGLVTELPPGQAATSVQHLAMLCPEPRDLSRLENLSSRANDRYQSFFLGEWNRWFTGCNGQSLLQRIRR